MKVDEKITLSNGETYGLLLDSQLDNANYFLAVLLKDGEEPTDKFKVLKEINRNGEVFVSEETDPLILQKLLEDYYDQAEDLD